MKKLNVYRYILALSLLFSANLFAQNSTAPVKLEQLMARMAQHKKIHATFVEKKYMSGIRMPITSSGELTFIAPATMIRNTLQPAPEKFKLAGDTITLERKGHLHSLQVNDYPELALYFEGIRALLGGNMDSLSKLYLIHLTGSLADWELVLRPLQQETTLATLSLRGNADTVQFVEVRLKDGDYSVMTINRLDHAQ